MKLYSFISKDVSKSSSSNNIDPYINTYTISEQTENKFRNNRLVLLGGITLFLVGVYFLIAFLFLYASYNVTENRYHVNTNNTYTTSISSTINGFDFFSSKYIHNLNSIDYEKDVNSNIPLQVWYLENSLLNLNMMPDHQFNKVLAYSQTIKNQQTGAVWIHRIQVTFYRSYIEIPSNHFKTNYSTILS